VYHALANRPLRSAEIEEQMELYDLDASLMPTRMVRYILDVEGPYAV
jgi:hypothetical protein